MTKKKMFRYLGRNGIITTGILLDGIDHIPMVRLTAKTGYVLTNGEIETYSITVEETQVNQWREIPYVAKEN